MTGLGRHHLGKITDNFYPEVQRFVEKNCRKIRDGKMLFRHFKRTVYWINRLDHGADEALLVAAIAHDIERLFPKKQEENLTERSLTAKDSQKLHQERGAEIIADFLESKGAPAKLIKRVKMLVAKHEEGGNKDQDLLKDADSLSFLENNVNFFVEEMVPRFGKTGVREKLDWMFERISSDKAREIARPMYDVAIRKLK